MTGSIGILVKAKQGGFATDMAEAVHRRREHGLLLGDEVVRFALSVD